MEIEIKRDENTINDIAEKLELISNTNMVTKEELLLKFVAKDVLKSKMITVAGQIIIEYEKEIINSNQIIKGYEDYIGDNKIRNDILDKVCGENVKDICSEKDEVFKNNSNNRFIKIVNNNKRELQSNKQILLSKVSIIVYYSFYIQDINFNNIVIDILHRWLDY